MIFSMFDVVVLKIVLFILQLNFILTQGIALLFAYGYRKIYTYDRFSYNMRLCGTLVPGVCLAYFCYGRYVITSIFQPSNLNAHLFQFQRFDSFVTSFTALLCWYSINEFKERSHHSSNYCNPLLVKVAPGSNDLRLWWLHFRYFRVSGKYFPEKN